MNLSKYALALGVAFTSSIALPYAAHAGSKAHADPHAAGAEGGVGLPQFDPSTFPSQIFWLAIAFTLLYLVFSRRTLPEISGVIENRQKHIQSDLDTAERLKSEAQAVQTAYEEKLEIARQEASNAFFTTDEAIKDKTAKKMKSFQSRSTKKLNTIEQNLEKAKAEALQDMDRIAAEIAQDAGKKIIGVEADITQLETLVRDINQGEKKAKAA